MPRPASGVGHRSYCGPIAREDPASWTFVIHLGSTRKRPRLETFNSISLQKPLFPNEVTFTNCRDESVVIFWGPFRPTTDA